MSHIALIETALPERSYSINEVSAIGDRWLGGRPQEHALFQRFLRSSDTQKRHFALDAEQMLALNGLHARSDFFERFAPPLGAAAVGRAMQRAALSAETLGALVFTSCSCPTIPAVDGLIIDQLKLRRELPRLPVYQHGCAGGVIGLQLAADLAKVRGPVALAAVELCSLVFQPQRPNAAELVGSALFADGAACAIVGPESDRGLVFRANESYLVPGSRHLMGYDIEDDGFHLRLDRELPQKLAEVAPQRVNQFLGLHGLSPSDITHWLFHPGGVKILDYLEHTFGLAAGQSHWARDVLRNVGNLSSATILFVVQRFLEARVAKPGEKIMIVGVGPGLTLELILFEWLGVKS